MSKYLNLLEQHNIKPILLDSVDLLNAQKNFSAFNDLIHECDLQEIEVSSHMRKLFNQNRTTFNQRKIIIDMNDLLPLVNFTLDYSSGAEIFKKNSRCDLHFNNGSNLHESYMYLIYKRDDSNCYDNAIEFNLKCNIHFVKDSLYIEYREIEVLFVNHAISSKLTYDEIMQEVTKKAFKQIEDMLLLNIVYHITNKHFYLNQHHYKAINEIVNQDIKNIYAVKVDDFLTNFTFIEM